VQVLISVPSPAVGRRIGDALLDARLCACAQLVGPVESRYLWQGKRETAKEWLLLAKTRRGAFPALERAVRRLHPYRVPEVIATALGPVSPPYLDWVVRSTMARR
jgi:periplasmic divalent cation tolerance protein